ncbi:uncharacterized protein LOC142979894 [Anticarsia gemmatalis]|uniref:uncharacterized protein LOC142979894 n=1 Tax=Anticarsia gemmatalis TaxID=129554 RepID=UPI003F770779
MKFLAVFAAVLAVACANNTWTLQQVSNALQSPYTDASLKPYLEKALNEMMAAIWAGEEIVAVTITVPSAEPSGWTLAELSELLQNPETDPTLIPYLEALLNQMMDAIVAGVPVDAAVVAAPAMELHHYTLSELSAALEDPATNPELKPFLTAALDQMMDNLFNGNQMEVVTIAVPAGLTPVVPEIIPSPADIDAPLPAPVPEVPAPEVPASSPLVQIIVNINQQQANPTPVAPVVVPELVVDPVIVVDDAPVDPVIVVDDAHVSPIQVVDEAPVSPIQVVDEAPVSPIQVVDQLPASPIQVVDQVPASPIQVVDVAPAA